MQKQVDTANRCSTDTGNMCMCVSEWEETIRRRRLLLVRRCGGAAGGIGERIN